MGPEYRDAIEQFFRQHGKGVGGYVLARVGDPELAEEITARVFLTVVRCWQQCRGPVLGWLWAIVRSELARHFCARPATSGLLKDLPATDAIPPEQLAQRELHNALQTALAQLSEEQQQLIGMKFFLGLRNQEIASSTGLSQREAALAALSQAIQAARDPVQANRLRELLCWRMLPVWLDPEFQKAAEVNPGDYFEATEDGICKPYRINERLIRYQFLALNPKVMSELEREYTAISKIAKEHDDISTSIMYATEPVHGDIAAHKPVGYSVRFRLPFRPTSRSGSGRSRS